MYDEFLQVCLEMVFKKIGNYALIFRFLLHILSFCFTELLYKGSNSEFGFSKKQSKTNLLKKINSKPKLKKTIFLDYITFCQILS